MKSWAGQPWRMTALWLFLALLAIIVLSTRLTVSFDLSAFLPRQSDLAQQILLEQLENGPGSRLMVIGLNGGSQDQLAEISEQLKNELASNAVFSTVQNGEFSDEDLQAPAPIGIYYLLMADIDYSKDALDQILELRLHDLALGGGLALQELIARDPYLVTIDILERLAPVDTSGDLWFADDGSAVLMAETNAAAIDIVAQAEAVDAVKTAFATLDLPAPMTLEITGVGPFGVELQNTIRKEAKLRSILASAALFLVMLFVYRNPRFPLLAILPIGVGFLVGLAMVSLLFENVHGITLAFGFTLMGIAIDYPLHLFSHSQSRSGKTAIREIWPTMRLGAISTAIVYLALTFSGSEGLAQLGIFTASGVIVAALLVRTWLPVFLSGSDHRQPEKNGDPIEPKTRFVPALLVLGLAVVIVLNTRDDGLWNDNLSSLSPVPEGRLIADLSLRSAAGTPNLRYQLVLHSPSLQTLLRDNEALNVLLADAAADGLLDSWQSTSQLLSSDDLQNRRRNAIPDADVLQARLDSVLAESPFRGDAFEPFAVSALASQSLPPMTREQLADSPFRSWLDSHLLKLGDEWVSLISLRGPKPQELRERVATWSPDVELADLQQSSVNMIRDYRDGAMKTVSIAAFIIIGLLWFQRKKLSQVLWIVLTVASALAITVALVVVVHDKLTVIHLVGLLLVLGLGVDYALFLSRSESAPERRATNQAVLACVASTAAAFSILAGSPIPILKFLGLTVAVGSVASYLLSVSGSRLLGKT